MIGNNMLKMLMVFIVMTLSGCSQLATIIGQNAGQTSNEQLSNDQPVLSIYLVRHAEKLKGQGKNPDLTKAGQKRANSLAMKLADIKLDAVYSTPYKRTMSTASPTAMKQEVVIISEYIPAKLFAEKLRNEHKHQNVLVVGHSNTIPALIKALGYETEVTITEQQYGDLYIVHVFDNEVKLQQLSF